jgi:dolichol-phosphate mannosyltransferase
MKRISFVLPVYRNEHAVTLTYQQIRRVMTAELQRYGYEIVFVDDGSDDGSPAELAAIKAGDEHVRVVTFTRNFGQMAAILAGLKQASGDVIIQLSADLQDPIALVPQMVAEHERGSEVVACHREHREDPWSRRVTSRALYAILRLSLPQIPAGGFDYILLDRKVVDAFNAVEVRNRFFQGDVLWFGYKTTFIPYTRPKRTIGRSQYTFSKKLKNSIDAILDSSYLPIRFMSLLGVLTAFVGFLYAVDIVYGRLRHNIPFTGWAPIMILILVIGGVLMLMLGIIGEYIWRIYDEVKGKPNYVVRQIH